MLGFYDRLSEKKEEYLNDVVEKASHHVNVVIYGAGRVAKPIFAKLTEKSIPVACFAVSDSAINENEFFGKRVIQIDDLSLDRENTLFIIAVKYVWADEVRKKLEENGYSNYIFPPKEIDYFAREQSDWVHRPLVEITTKIGCKVDCRYCPQELFLKAYCTNSDRDRFFDMEKYKKCLSNLPKDTIIDFCGFTEPFLHPQAIDMILYTYEQGFDLKLHTTLVGLTLEGFQKIKDIPFLYVVLHVPDENEYAKIPMTEEYFKLLDLVLDQKRPDGMNFVDTANCQGEPHPEVVKYTQGKLRIMSQLYDRAGNLQDDIFTPIDPFKGKIYCVRVNRKLNYNELLPDGSLLLCDFDFGMQHVLGNLLEESYEDIMNGDKMKAIEAALDDDSCPLLCRTCNYAVAHNQL